MSSDAAENTCLYIRVYIFMYVVLTGNLNLAIIVLLSTTSLALRTSISPSRKWEYNNCSYKDHFIKSHP